MKQLGEQILVSCVDENPINCRKHTYNKYAWIVKGQVQHVCHIVYNITHLKKNSRWCHPQ